MAQVIEHFSFFWAELRDFVIQAQPLKSLENQIPWKTRMNVKQIMSSLWTLINDRDLHLNLLSFSRISLQTNEKCSVVGHVESSQVFTFITIAFNCSVYWLRRSER